MPIFRGPRAVPECLRKCWIWGLAPFSRAKSRRNHAAPPGPEAQTRQSMHPATPTTIRVATATSTSTPLRRQNKFTSSTSQNNESHNPPGLKLPPPHRAAKMALDSFFHNKIESMKLEIIQGQAVLRRLEAQRNEYNSRGEITAPEAATTC